MSRHIGLRSLLAASALAVGVAACDQPLTPEREREPPLFSKGFYTNTSTTGVPYADIGLPPRPIGFIRSHAINSRGDVVGHEGFGPMPVKSWVWTKGGGWTDIGSLNAAMSTFAYSMNDNGDVVGASSGRAFRWSGKTGIVDITSELPNGSFALAINNGGAIVGGMPVAAGGTHAFLWTKEGGLVDLGSLFPDPGFTEAWGINDRGDVVGLSGPVPPVTDPPTPFAPTAFLWTKDGGMVSLGTLPGGTTSRAWGINNCGQVAGDARVDGIWRAFFWSASDGMVDVGDLGGPAAGSPLTKAFAGGINNKGHVAGFSVAGDGLFHSFVWSKATGMKDLGTVVGAAFPILSTGSRGFVVNNRGQAVGLARMPLGGTLTTTLIYDTSKLGLSDADGCQ